MPPVFSKNQYAYDEIKRRILTDDLAAGSVVSQERIAAELGISTTPVREALKRLASEGLVRLDTHRDARVTALSPEEARSLYEVRQAVDPLAAALAAERRTDDDLAEIGRTLAALDPITAAGDLDALAAHRAFHRAVYRASHNEPLVEVLEGLWDKADRYRQVGLRAQADSEEDVARVRAEHQALADAVVAGDTARAEQVMRDHVAHSLGRRAIAALETA
ncbi:GntR family transcriptional regulator [Nocardioides zeae]|uniref:GntR family transcriptional regulator n=1 Tax=Nocardioides imazamoxiresistens TaxID=3231893 RepID=A0ABU3PQP8_9ACTN|nr:GntR family transcriptional regulator [Nocardioides zeae]MDT9591560.1 GntR family transcriptional regulator [Nocardioides zeae]